MKEIHHQKKTSPWNNNNNIYISETSGLTMIIIIMGNVCENQKRKYESHPREKKPAYIV